MPLAMKVQIRARIERFGPGKVFMAKDFLDIASRGSIDVALGSLTRAGEIRRIRRGLYDLPRVSAALGGELSPDIDQAARALARRNRWTIVPDGPWAANLLGLSTQVPAKIVYLSDGPSRKIPVGRRSIQFKHARPQTLAGGDTKSVLVIQALRYLGNDGISAETMQVLSKSLSPAERKRLLKTTRLGVDWIYVVAKELTRRA
jgi:Family of unknown function (DUF6088)